MLTSELKSQIDRVWEAFWTGGLSNPLTVIEQMTYLLFIRRLDELQTQKEQKANLLRQPIEAPIFQEAEYPLRWSRFKDADAAKLAFSTLLQSGHFNSRQIRFIDTIINFFIAKGIVEPARLFESPFTDLHAGGMLGIFDEVTSGRIIALVAEVNGNAEVA